MAESHDPLAETLDGLGLTRFYPSRLTREISYQITDEALNCKNPVSDKDLPWHFLSRVNCSDYKARNTILPSVGGSTTKRFGRGAREKQVSNVAKFHPLDVEVAVFSCCDPITKQDLVQRLWQCRLAVPFVVQPDVKSEPEVHLWPLRSIVMQWHSAVPGSVKPVMHEKAIVKQPMKSIGILRLGDTGSVSKSILLNETISESEKTHHIFFNRDSDSSVKTRSGIVDGMIELGWFFPKGNETQVFDECLLFSNLRGDGLKHPNQLKIMASTLSTVIVVCKFSTLQDEGTIFILNSFLGKSVSVIVLVTEDGDGEGWEDKYINKHFPSTTAEDFELMSLSGMQRQDRTEAIREFIRNMRSAPTKSIESALADFKGNVDESSPVFKTGRECAEHVLESLKRDFKHGKEKLFPFQGENWKRWSEANKEYHRLEKKPKDGDIAEYRDDMEVQKLDYRKAQYDQFKRGMPTGTRAFIYYLSTLDPHCNKLFLRYLKLGLDDISRQAVPRIYEDYKHTIDRIQHTKDEQQRLELTRRLEMLDKKLSDVSIGLEHFTREVGQIYESIDAQSDNDIVVCFDAPFRRSCVPVHKETAEFNYRELPSLIAQVLLEGYPVEVMDGDVSAVPVVWVRAVLRSLSVLLGKRDGRRDISIYTMSVLGIQSSGKSTMLNTMFGFQFAVSAGRCTKGVYLQIVKIADNLRTQLGFDYVFVMDTEGLKASELLSADTTKHDNELSTFVIGSADATVINLMGENITYLSDNLPITVHAFLRMDMAGLSPKCAIVYQSVDKQNRDKLMQQNRELEKVLNDLTEKACDTEKIPKKLFKEVIEFNISEGTYHIPSLLEGEQPMAPTNAGYSAETVYVRKQLLTQMGDQNQDSYIDIEQLAEKLLDLWDAIKKDNFVYEFRNTLETAAMEHLDKRMVKIQTQLDKVASDILSEASMQIQNGNTEDQCNSIVENAFAKINFGLADQCGNSKRELQQYFREPEKVFARSLKQWEPGSEEKVEQMRSDIQKRAKQELQDLLDERCTEIQLQRGSKAIFDDTVEEIRSLDDEKGLLSQEELMKVMNKKWDEAESQLVAISSKEKKIDKTIEADAMNILKDLFKSHFHIADEKKGSMPLKRFCFSRFKPQSSHLPDKQKAKSKASRSLFFKPKDPLLPLQEIFDSVKGSVESRLKNMQESNEPYKRRELKDILGHVKQRASLSIEIVTPIFQVELALAVAGECAAQMEMMQENYDRIHDPKGILLRYKDAYVEYLQTHVNERFLKAFADGCCTTLSDGLVHEVFTSTELFVAEKMRQETHAAALSSKRTLLLAVYTEMLEAKDFGWFELHINNPELSLKRCLALFTKSALGTLNASMKAYAAERVVCLLNKICSRLDSLVGRLKNYEDAKKLIDSLVEELDDIVILRAIDRLRRMPLKSVNVSEHVSALKDGLRTAEEAIKQGVFCCFDDDKKREFLEMRTVQYLLKETVGCTARCPWCKEICMHGKGHQGLHETIQHRPLGSSGDTVAEKRMFSLSSTRKLNLRTCSEQTVSFFSFHQEYETTVDGWKIRSNSSRNESLLWKWFMVQFEQDIVNKYEVSMQSIPKPWRSYNRTTVLRELRGLKYGV